MPVKINVRPSLYIYFVLLLFFVPLKWLFAWVFAAVFHEVCHWAAVKLCGAEIHSIKIGLGGAEIKCGPMSNPKRLFAVLSGPLGGLLPLFFARWIPRTALCCWVLSMYNLLPLLNLDGGRAMEILLGARAVVLQRIFLLVLSVGAAYVSITLNLGLLPICVIVFLWLKGRNNPCKQNVCKVQ